jgi:hypothetical protein
MDYKEKLQPFKEKIENYLIIRKLTDCNYNVGLIEEEFMPYDGYNIKCPTIRIARTNLSKTTLFSISINPKSGEFIIELDLTNTHPYKLNKYLKEINSYNYLFNNSSLSTDLNYDCFYGYFWNNDDMVEKILDLYLEI